MAFDGYGMPKIDFGTLAQLPDIYDKARLGAVRERTLAELGQGNGPMDYAAAARGLLAAGDTQGGLSLARLGDAQALREYNQSRDARDFSFRQQESARAQQNSDRGFGLQQRQLDVTLQGQRVPPGYRPGPDGGLAAIPGGPQDPAVIARTTDARAKPREFNVTDVTKLSEEGAKANQISTFADTFEPRFGGYRTEGIGNAATWLGRNVPELASRDTAEAARWWQGYDRYKNVIRNDLFGAALTATEKAAFERADINAGMDPATIKNNLKIQKQIALNGLKRKANALISSGYDPGAIAAAYGLDLKEIGVTAQPRRGGAAPAAPAAAPAASPSPSGVPNWSLED